MFKDDTDCTIAPYFKIHEGKVPAFKALSRQLVEITRQEPGCRHYAFSFSGLDAHCREGYVNAEALLAHLQNVGELLGQLLQVAELVRLEVHAPADEVEKLRGPMSALEPQFFVLEPGIRRAAIG
ncbi:putative quinol monooxygenase [Pelomonas sp. BJYL3]|uniref:putative quinol monooxygenase n=1 Tax=Pelomonas sp. BJYL3 TaxID=2976697 RepID=UPI0022B31941|nr:antibiotic biosynthesis monooxygenase [Pelomonas sp. BJYL3]